MNQRIKSLFVALFFMTPYLSSPLVTFLERFVENFWWKRRWVFSRQLCLLGAILIGSLIEFLCGNYRTYTWYGYIYRTVRGSEAIVNQIVRNNYN
jgi:hypothetical protein